MRVLLLHVASSRTYNPSSTWIHYPFHPLMREARCKTAYNVDERHVISVQYTVLSWSIMSSQFSTLYCHGPSSQFSTQYCHGPSSQFSTQYCNYYWDIHVVCLLTLGAHARSNGYCSCPVCVYVCVCVCVSTLICRLTHWNHKRDIPTDSS